MPYSSTDQQNGMPIGPGGLLPGLNAYGQISNIAYRRKVVAKTANYTVTAAESGTIFTTQGATGAVVFTLPATTACDGLEFIFYNCEDVDMTVTAGTVDTMTAINDVAADSVKYGTTSLKAGNAFWVFGDGTNVHVIAMGAGTVTVAS